jgi:DNA-directed RNA polymerase specialized sigma24 family protein
VNDDPSPGGVGFREFFLREYVPVVAFLCRAGFAAHVADDATAHAMSAAHERWADITHNARAWVRTAAYRQAVRNARVIRSELPRLVAGGYRPPTGDGTEPLREIELDDELLGMLAMLTDRQRLVMSYHLDGFTTGEIARMAGMRPTTVRSHLRDARSTFRSLVAGREVEETRR